MFTTMRKAKVESINLTLKCTWICPYCDRGNEYEENPSPYSSVADDPADVMCEHCNDFSTLNFYGD
jgi:hypothetical protein